MMILCTDIIMKEKSLIRYNNIGKTDKIKKKVRSIYTNGL